MDHDNSSARGCLIAMALWASALIFVVFTCWNVAVGRTDAGNPVYVSDYVLGPVEALSKGFFRSGANAPAENTYVGQDKINLEIFNILTPGLTPISATKSLLEQGELLSSSYVGGTDTRVYRIKNSDGSSVMLTFQNGVLASKDQIGLR